MPTETVVVLGAGAIKAAALVESKVLSVTCAGDATLNPGPQQELAAAIPTAESLELVGPTGHVNFFTEMETLTKAVTAFMQA